MVAGRIIRGFRRLGAVVTIPLLLISVFCIVWAGANWANSPAAGPWDNYPAAKPNIYNCFDAGRQPSEEECKREYEAQQTVYEAHEKSRSMRQFRTEILLFALFFFCGAVLWYFACWAVGWVLAGFASD